MMIDIPIHDQPPNNKKPKKHNNNARQKGFSSRFGYIILLLSLATTTILASYLYTLNVGQFSSLSETIDNILSEKYHLLQTSEFKISPGMDLEAAHFLDHLNELQYKRENSHIAQGNNTFKVQGNSIFVNSTNQNNAPSEKYQLLLKGPVVKQILNLSTGAQVRFVSFPGITLTHFLDSLWEIRKPVQYNQIPKDLITAVLATEDQNYLAHPGIDFFGLLRATLANLKAGKIVQGGSTITQQTVKVLTKNSGRTFSRKLNEALLAIALEYRYSKEELLTVYLNNVYLGHASPFEIRGVAAASDYILGKDLSEINLEECAILAGLIRSPNSASPLRNPVSAAKRTQTVLNQMANQGDSLAGEISIGKKLQRIRHHNLLHKQSWYFDQIVKELKQNRISVTSKQQLIVKTPLNPWMQVTTTDKLYQQLKILRTTSKTHRKNLQGATVILDPYSGGVKALAGGYNYQKSPFNRAVSANRQIGSLIKPFIYLVALGGTDVVGKITQADIIADLPLIVRRNGTTWRPANYDRKYKGNILVRSALTESRNIPAVHLGQKIGLENILPVVREIGISDQIKPYPSVFLGAVESTPLQMAGAYATIANGGSYFKPHFLTRVTRGAKTIYQPPVPKTIFSSSPCYVVTDMLSGVVTEGTARRSKQLGLQQIVAGKTGTTNNNYDSWFAGYTKNLVMVTWVGRDDNKSCRLTGATGALPVWIATLTALTGKSAKQSFVVPPGVTFLDIDPITGKPASFFSTDAVKMAFVSGTRPEVNNKWLQKDTLLSNNIVRKVQIKAVKRKRVFSRRNGKKQVKESWLAAQRRWAAGLF